MSVLRRLPRAVAVFVGASLAFLAVGAQLAPGWRPGQPLPPVDPQPLQTRETVQARLTDQEDVTIPRRDGSSAEAWIVTPRDADGPVPGVVLVHGAGTSGRNAMLEEATALAEAGVAAISYHKRHEDYSFIHRDYPQLADDAIDAAAVLADHPRVDADRLGMFTHSEGGWVAPFAAESAPEIFAFLILGSSTIATPLEEVAWIVDSRISGAPDWLRRIPAAGLSGGRAFINYLDTDITAALGSIDTPIYAVWGAEDPIAPVAGSLQALTAAASAPVTTVVLPGADHGLGGTGPWIADAAAWVEGLPGTAVDQHLGVEPASHHGIPRAHEPSWVLNPFFHAAVALLLAASSVFLPPLRLRRRRTPPQGQPDHNDQRDVHPASTLPGGS